MLFGVPLFRDVVVVGAVLLPLALAPELARVFLVVQRVVLALLPPVALRADRVVRAAVHVVDDEVGRLPVGAGHRLVGEDVRLPAVVLPVVRVDARRLVVLGEVEGASLRLEVEDVEVVVAGEVVDQLDRDVLLRVREGAEVPVLALV